MAAPSSVLPGQDDSLESKRRQDAPIEGPSPANEETPDPCNSKLPQTDPLVVEALKGIVMDVGKKSLVARRYQIRRVRRAELYWQSLQYLWTNPVDGQLYTPTEAQLFDDSALQDQPRYQFVTNIYQAYGLSFIAVAAQDIPDIAFFPEDPNDEDDVTAAKAANDVAELIQRNNDPEKIFWEMAYHAWTGGLIGIYVRYVTDGNKFGWDYLDDMDSGQVMLADGGYVCPDCGSESGMDNPAGMCPECGAQLSDDNVKAPDFANVPISSQQVKLPRGQEVISIYGALDLNTPIWCDHQEEFPYCNLQFEVPKAKLKAAYPWSARKIGENSTAMADDEYARVARISVKESLPGPMPTDILYDLITLNRIWVRPWVFECVKDPAIKQRVYELFPDGAYMAFAGDVYCESRNETMDSVWVVRHAMPGRGSNRPAIGDTLMNIQDQVNTERNICMETWEYGIPPIYADSEVLDFDALQNQTAEPGSHYPAKAKQAMALSDGFFQPAAAEVNPQMLAEIQELCGPLAQLLTGMYPALFGGDTGDNDLMDVDEHIPTPSGFVRNGDLNDGDTIFGQDGKQYLIEKAHPHKTKQAFKVSFDDGTSTIVHDGHLWTTFTRNERVSLKRRTKEWREQRRTVRLSRATGSRGSLVTALLTERNKNFTGNILPPPQGGTRRTDEILATLKDAQGGNNHSIRIADAIDLPERELIVDPYCFGAWLGDGAKSGGRFTGLENDALRILFHFREAGFSFCKEKQINSWYISGLMTKLRKIGVLFNKHIPDEYLWASKSQRLALLQGLMDTDGCCSTRGQSIFVNTNKLLADGVYHLACSLGLKPTISTANSIPIYNSRLDRWYGGDVLTYSVKWTSTLPVFRLERKLKRLPKSVRKTQDWRYITDIELVGERTMRCLTTSNPTGLYLFGKSFNVTHNTAKGIGIQRDQAMGRVGLPWKAMKEAWCKAVELAVKCFRDNRSDDISLAQKDPTKKPVTIRLDELKGEFKAYPEADNAFPRMQSDKKAAFEKLLGMAKDVPGIAELFASPANLEQIQAMEGLIDFDNPPAASRDKQMIEIEELLSGTPQPGVDPQTGLPTGQMEPSVKIGPLDRDQYEFAECERWATDPAGMAAMKTNPGGYANVVLHAQMHQQRMQQVAQANSQKDKPSESIQIQNLPDSGQIQMAKQAGIVLTAADIQSNDMKEVAKDAAKTAIKSKLAPKPTPGGKDGSPVNMPPSQG